MGPGPPLLESSDFQSWHLFIRCSQNLHRTIRCGTFFWIASMHIRQCRIIIGLLRWLSWREWLLRHVSCHPRWRQSYFKTTWSGPWPVHRSPGWMSRSPKSSKHFPHSDLSEKGLMTVRGKTRHCREPRMCQNGGLKMRVHQASSLRTGSERGDWQTLAFSPHFRWEIYNPVSASCLPQDT